MYICSHFCVVYLPLVVWFILLHLKIEAMELDFASMYKNARKRKGKQTQILKDDTRIVTASVSGAPLSVKFQADVFPESVSVFVAMKKTFRTLVII